MQPLSYQATAVSCWVTSMLNGLLFLSRGRRKVPPQVYHALHAILTDTGVYYYTNAQVKDLEEVLGVVRRCMGYSITYYAKENVEPAIQRLHFKNQVAVCDIGAGEHSILLNGRENNWICAFDPYWANVSQSLVKEGCYEIQPRVGGAREGTVNLKINRDHLLKRRFTEGFQTGAVSFRFLTVMENP